MTSPISAAPERAAFAVVMYVYVCVCVCIFAFGLFLCVCVPADVGGSVLVLSTLHVCCKILIYLFSF